MHDAIANLQIAVATAKEAKTAHINAAKKVLYARAALEESLPFNTLVKAARMIQDEVASFKIKVN